MVIHDVEPASAAGRAGIKKGSVIVRIGDFRVHAWVNENYASGKAVDEDGTLSKRAQKWIRDTAFSSSSSYFFDDVGFNEDLAGIESIAGCGIREFL